jgi:two-component system, chemotaxis family, protein-glutamate methylesterase/glutaminase
MSVPQTNTNRPLVKDRLRVMVVDDSLIMRGMIARMIGQEPEISEVVALVGNGQLAVDRAQKGDLDVIILDIEMPIMDGITALPKLLAVDPRIVVIMASTLTTRNAEISLKALAAGAKDYIPKPSAVTPGAGAEEFKRELLEKVRVLGHRYRRSGRLASAGGVATQAGAKSTAVALRPLSPGRPQALAIGSSTGGPNALLQLLKAIPHPLRVPTFITQHMPPTFTGMLADNITRDTGHICAEARHGEAVLPGRIFLAPGDYHMTASRSGQQLVVQLNQDAKENFCRPAVDPMLRSLTEAYGRNLLIIMLTGMGQDGLKGSESAVKAGGNVLAQDEASSVVWGMPGAVARAGLCCAVMPVQQLAGQVTMLVGR